MKLHQMKCVPCDDVQPLRGAALNRYIRQAKRWKLVKDRITKDYKFKNDVAALEFIDKIGRIAVSQGHHPVATWAYNKVSVELWTHAIGGLSKNDFILAAKFDAAYNKI